MKKIITTYYPGIILFLIALIVGMVTYQDYGMGWDEPLQRDPGVLSYEYAFHGDPTLFNVPNDNHGAGFEMLLLMAEKAMHVTKARDVYLMRHLFTHVFFLLSLLAAYVLIYRVFKKHTIACLGFLMLLLSPRIYAHSYANSKDLPFLATFLMTLAVAEMAFSKNKTWLFFIAGLLCGYTTSIRIMGIMLACFLIFFMVIDFIGGIVRKEKYLKVAANMVLFSAGFCVMLYLSWPFLWRSPVHTFLDSFAKMSHFDWEGSVLLNGKMEPSTNIPWFYFPVWFCITTPVLWVGVGVTGMLWVLVDFVKRPLLFFSNSRERNYILWLGCFAVPVAAVIFLHSVIYDDWRHLYFVYPPFVLCGLYFADKAMQWKLRPVVLTVAFLPVATTVFSMVKYHPHQYVYFNNLVPHQKEYLRKHYELDYWGSAYMQGLEYIAHNDWGEHIKIASTGLVQPLANNINMLQDRDSKRMIVASRDDCDYIITNFRGHPDDYNYGHIVYSVVVHNSTILCVYKMR